MLAKLIKTRAGRRIVVTLVVEILVISGIALYMSRQTGHTLPSTAPPGSATVAGYPQTVNLTSSPTQDFTLTFTVLERYVSGITLSIDTASVAINASAHFAVTGTSWNAGNGGNVVKSTAVSMQAGFRDTNVTLVVTGSGNVSGWIGVYQSALWGQVSPSFVKVYVISYHTGKQTPPPPPAPFIRLDNLPATITVPSGAKGTFQINYTAHNIAGPLAWSSNLSWIAISTVNDTASYANYTAPTVSSNTTYVAKIGVSSANGAANSSTLTVNVYVSGRAPTRSGILLDNLPATIMAHSGSEGTFIINYTAINAAQPLSWLANESWVTVSTRNGSTAFANYTVPVVSANTTSVVNISVTSANGVSNSSTITFDIVFEKTQVPGGSIRFENLPATITVPSGTSGTYAIDFAAVNATGPINWTASVPWVSLVPVNESTTDGNYTAPVVTPPPLSMLNLSRLFSFNMTFVVSITAVSSNGIENSSTLTFIVTAVNTSLPRPDYLIYTSICLNNSGLELKLDGGLHLDINAPSPPPHAQGNQSTVYMIYTLICLNNSELSIGIDGGIHIDISSPQPAPNTTFIFYTAIIANNSELSIKIKGGITARFSHPPSSTQQNPAPTLISFVSISSTDSEINIQGDGQMPASVGGAAGTSSAGDANGAAVHTLAYTSMSLNNSEASIKVKGGVSVYLEAAPSADTAIQLMTVLEMNASELEVSLSGGVKLNVPLQQPGALLHTGTFIYLNGSEMEVSVDGGISVGIEPLPSQGNQSTVYAVYTLICLNNSELSIGIDGGIHIKLTALTPSVTTIICINGSSLKISEKNRDGNGQSRGEEDRNGNAGDASGDVTAAIAYSNGSAIPSAKIKLMTSKQIAYAIGLLYTTTHGGSPGGNLGGQGYTMFHDGSGMLLSSSLAFIFLNPTGPPT